MRILFAFNGSSQAEPEQIFTAQAIPSAQLGTRGTLALISDVLAANTIEASNDGDYSVAGHDGHVGHAECVSQVENIPIKVKAKIVIPVIIDLAKNNPVFKPIDNSDANEFDGVEYRNKIALNTKLVHCESCIHFDFLIRPVSHSCMIGAASPHKRYPKMTLPDIVAECTQRQVNPLSDIANVITEVLSEDIEYPF